MAGSSFNREDYKTAIPQLSAKMKEILDNNIVINRTVINLTEGKVSDLNSYLGYFQSLTTGYFQAIAGDIQYLTSREAYINHLKADIAGFGYLTAETADLRYATIQSLTAATARIGDLEADHVSVADLTAATGRISDLEADHVSVAELNAAKGRISDLEADHVSVSDLDATNADVSHLKVGDLTIGGVTVNIYDLAMAIKSDAMASGTTWYKVSATTPSAPAGFDPTSEGWSQTEPAYVAGTTNHLYSCLRVVYADDDPQGTRSYQWSDVHLIQSWEAARSAYTYADDANTAADAAKNAATEAMKGLGQVEDVVGTLNWITEHSAVTGDTTPQAGKSYYIKNQDNTFTLVTDVAGKNPAQEGWYELSEAIQNYILSHLALTNDGLYVMKDGSEWKVLIGADGVYILDENNVPVNQMTDNGNIIGYEDETRAKIDFHSLQLIDSIGNRYMHVSDLRNQNGSAVVSEHFVFISGENTYYMFVPVDDFLDVYDSQGSRLPSTAYTKNTAAGSITLSGGVLTNREVFRVEYETTSDLVKAYTIGTRRGTTSLAPLSTVIGQGCISGTHALAEGVATSAVGRVSHAEGFQSSSYGMWSHAEGRGSSTYGEGSHAEGYTTEATGDYSHAEGESTQASGDSSHAQNTHTVAGYDSQTAIGKYNDNKQSNAFEIGNGTDDNNRSNAFEVDWSGNVLASGDVEDGQGNVLANKAESASLAPVATSGDYDDLSNKPALAPVATSGDYDDLSNKPTIPATPNDYVVGSGTTGGWSWRKWKSGKVEAWYNYATSSTSTYGVWVSPIRYKDLTVSIPSGIFSENPRLFVTSRNSQAWVVYAVPSSTTQFTVRMATVASNAITTSIRIYATTW